MKKSVSREVMTLAWVFAKENNLPMNISLQIAWRNIKLMKFMTEGIRKFSYRRKDGSTRIAYGTLHEDFTPTTLNTNKRKQNPTVQSYYDIERASWRSFKKANLLMIA